MPARTRQATRIPAAQVREELHDEGLRATPARIAVLALLRKDGVPLTHGEVADALAPRGWDRATVYRNLISLTEAGLVRRRDLGDHMWRFEASGAVHDGATHPHFVCTACGTIHCLPGLEIKASRGAGVPKAVRTHRVEIQVKGLCDSCC